MGNNIAFQPMGKTYQANATTTSQTILVQSDISCNQLMVASHENTAGTGKPVYFRVSTDSNVTITAPSAGNPQYAMAIPPGQVRVFTVPTQFTTSGLYIAFITEGSTAECYFTPGEGL